jgi:hypothetical protein
VCRVGQQSQGVREYPGADFDKDEDQCNYQ